MVRLLGILVGLGLVTALLVSLGVGVANVISEEKVESVEHRFHHHPKEVAFAHDGPFGMYDQRQLQRGFQVYKEVCAACHGLSLVTFRDLEGIGYNEAETKAIASQWVAEVPTVNPDTGEATTRKAIPADKIPSPYLNDVAARAGNNNALPPDLSLMTKARHDGTAYVYSLLTGYQKVPANLPKENHPGTGLHYNPYFANLNLAMPAPLTSEGQVSYQDGTKASVDQMSKDVAAFLTWTAEPKMDARKKTGMYVLIFLVFLTVLTYLAYRNVWADQKKRKVRMTGPLDPENMAKTAQASGEAGIHN